jgi:hypothetical protein
VAVVIALAATVVFAFAVVRSDGGERQPVLVGLPDAKDHPQYNPPEVVSAVGPVISDAKDHPRYRSTGIVVGDDGS